MELTSKELQRYSRHLRLPGFTSSKQHALKNSRVLVVGAGGLGCPVLTYLAAAGVGTIGIADDDVISLSNLQRQMLFTEQDLGKLKATTAAGKLREMNSGSVIMTHVDRVHRENALGLLGNYDVVVDCTDNFPAKYLLNDAAVMAGKPIVFGSCLGYEGQVSVFNVKSGSGTYSTNYRDIFPKPPEPETVQNCESAGVFGFACGIIGAIQAGEVIKLITGEGELLADRFLIFDAASMQQSVYNIKNRQARSTIKELIDYEDFCGISPEKSKSLSHKANAMKEITVQQLKEMKDSGADFQLIDVREPYEYDICHIGGELIPMSELPHHVDKVSRDRQVVIHCRSGKRSGDMLLWLEKNHDFDNLYNLKGGILAWAKDIDPSMPTY